MAHPASRRAVSTDVREALLVVAVGSAEGNLLNRLVDNQALQSNPINVSKEGAVKLGHMLAHLRDLIDHSQRVAADVKHCAILALRLVLQHNTTAEARSETRDRSPCSTARHCATNGTLS